MENKYNKGLDTVLLMYSVLKRLGNGGVLTFNQRLLSQKTQYLAQVFGISPVYQFNLYIKGPYSPELADNLFKLNADKIEPSLEKFTPDELEERFQKAKKYIKNKTARQLELITTLHWLENIAKLTNDAAIKKLKEIKFPSEEETIETIIFNKELCLLSKK